MGDPCSPGIIVSSFFRSAVPIFVGITILGFIESSESQNLQRVYRSLQKGGQDKKLVGYFQSDTGTINQLLHTLEVRRRCRPASTLAGLSANSVEGFASKFRPLLITQEVRLLQAAPWGPHP